MDAENYHQRFLKSQNVSKTFDDSLGMMALAARVIIQIWLREGDRGSRVFSSAWMMVPV